MITATDLGKVAVLLGGVSAEREISLQSGAAVLAALQRRGVDAYGIDVGKDIVSVLMAGNYDRAFVVLHGRQGEDGIMQAVLEMLDIPYTGSGVLGSALSMDKVRSKQIWQAAKLPTPSFACLSADSDWAAIVDKLGLPLAVKPVHEGSSLGTARVERLENLESAYLEAAKFDSTVMVEPWIIGDEYTVAIINGEALPVIRLETSREFYDYLAKYEADDTCYHCPCGLDGTAEKNIRALALEGFEVLGASSWGRIDLMLDDSGQPWLLENNTVPGMTDHSLVPMAAKAAGIEFDELVWRILASTVTGSALEQTHGC